LGCPWNVLMFGRANIRTNIKCAKNMRLFREKFLTFGSK